MVQISRRAVLASAAGAAAALPLAGSPATARPTALPTAPTGPPLANLTGHAPVAVRWLESGTPAEVVGGTTWGVPWPRGSFAPDQQFSLTTEAGAEVPVQTWPIGWWPDG